MITERKLKLRTVEINFAEGPDYGPPLVLLHGLPSLWYEFLPIMPAMILRWHVYALDLRGQGKSGRVPGQYLSKFYIADLIEFIQEQFSEPAVLYGHSAGGMIALSAASQLPDLIKAVILGDSPIDMQNLIEWMTSTGFMDYFSALQKIAGSEDSSIQEMGDQIANIPVQIPGQDQKIRYIDSPGIDRIQIQGLATVLSCMDPEVLEYHAGSRASEFLEGFEFENILGKITCPILLIQANPSLGGMMTDRAVKLVQSISPNVDHALIESAGHDLGLDTWEVAPLLRVIMPFLNALRNP